MASRSRRLSRGSSTRFTARPGPKRALLLADEPPLTGDERLDALAAAAAEYPAKRYRPPVVAAWAGDPRRVLQQPWFTTSLPSSGMREYLTFARSAEFRSRNIFTEERPLRPPRSVLADRATPASRSEAADAAEGEASC